MASYKEYARNQRKGTKTFFARYNKRHDVPSKNRLPVANSSERFRPMANVILLFPQVEV